jgi:putative endopeptidase
MISNLNKLNHDVDPDDWDLPAYIMNAYFKPTRNEVIFPASILQSPFLI